MTCELRLDGGKTSFSPGETLRGTLVFGPSAEAGEAEIVLGPRDRRLDTPDRDLPALFPGDEDPPVVQTVAAPYPAGAGSVPFSFQVPDGPFSFKGRTLAVEWVLEADAGVPGCAPASPLVVEVVPGTFRGAPRRGWDIPWEPDELEEEVRWYSPAFAYLGAGFLAAVAALLAFLFDGLARAAAQGGLLLCAAWALRAWLKGRRSDAAGRGRALFSARQLRPGERLSVSLRLVSPDEHPQATLFLTLSCRGDFAGDKNRAIEPAEEIVFEDEQSRSVGSVRAGAPLHAEASWEMPAGPFSYCSEELELAWEVAAKLVAGGKTVWEDGWVVELRP